MPHAEFDLIEHPNPNQQFRQGPSHHSDRHRHTHPGEALPPGQQAWETSRTWERTHQSPPASLARSSLPPSCLQKEPDQEPTAGSPMAGALRIWPSDVTARGRKIHTGSCIRPDFIHTQNSGPSGELWGPGCTGAGQRTGTAAHTAGQDSTHLTLRGGQFSRGPFPGDPDTLIPHLGGGGLTCTENNLEKSYRALDLLPTSLFSEPPLRTKVGVGRGLGWQNRTLLEISHILLSHKIQGFSTMRRTFKMASLVGTSLMVQ